jgi:RNase P/RNase MRP subunit p29
MPKQEVTVWQIDSGITGEVVVEDRKGKIVRASPCYHWMIGMRFEVIRQTRPDWKYERRDGGSKSPRGKRR